MMRVLAIDTATPATTVALGPEDPAELRHDPNPGERPAHATAVLQLVHELLGGADGWEAIDRIAVGIGPGTFTGLRIGIATARALAQARGLPLVGVSTLRALASTAADAHPGRPVAAVLDARRGEAFAAAWANGEEVMRPAALRPEKLAESLRALPETLLAVGDGSLKFKPVLVKAGIDIPEDGSPLHRVSALAHTRLAVAATPGPVLPDYLRVPDAELTRRQK